MQNLSIGNLERTYSDVKKESSSAGVEGKWDKMGNGGLGLEPRKDTS